MTKYNPFLSETFKNVWLNHFGTDKTLVKSFKYFENLEFLKSSSHYINIGSTHTKGISYSVNKDHAAELKKKVVLIYDVPTYFNIGADDLGQNIKVLRSKQYPGFLIETEKYKDLNDFMLDNFSKNSRNKNRKYKRRLEEAFDISNKMYRGDISKDDYDYIFDAFKSLLEKRFSDKQIDNNNLNESEWSFYYDVAFQLILENKASLFVIYDQEKIIGVTLCYFSESILFDAITVFDIDYFKFHLGAVTIMKLMEWCIGNTIKTLDFSKGFFEYKVRWSTRSYDFEYQIFYDSASLRSKLIANSLKHFYDFKNYLREKKVNEQLHKVKYKLKHRDQKKDDKPIYNFEELGAIDRTKTGPKINFELPENRKLKLMVFEFLYLYSEKYRYISLSKLKSEDHTYIIEGEQKSSIASISYA